MRFTHPVAEVAAPVGCVAHDRSPASRGNRLSGVLEACTDLDPDSLVPLGSGAEAHVYRGRLRSGRPVAVKVARAVILRSGNDPNLDTWSLLRQEAALTCHVRAYGVPAPEPLAAGTTDEGLGYLVSEFVDVDHSSPDPAEVGRTLGRIHAVPLPDLSLVCMAGQTAADAVVAERVLARLDRLRSSYGVDIELPPVDDALVGHPAPQREALAHMDYRAANWLVRRGTLRAVVDWSNALAGDPALDLARSIETGAIDRGVLDAYDGPAEFTADSDSPRHLVYRLDAAVMLAHVFLASDERTSAAHYVERCTAPAYTPAAPNDTTSPNGAALARRSASMVCPDPSRGGRGRPPVPRTTRSRLRLAHGHPVPSRNPIILGGTGDP